MSNIKTYNFFHRYSILSNKESLSPSWHCIAKPCFPHIISSIAFYLLKFRKYFPYLCVKLRNISSLGGSIILERLITFCTFDKKILLKVIVEIFTKLRSATIFHFRKMIHRSHARILCLCLNICLQNLWNTFICNKMFAL